MTEPNPLTPPGSWVATKALTHEGLVLNASFTKKSIVDVLLIDAHAVASAVSKPSPEVDEP